jgi:hypothetical protein
MADRNDERPSLNIERRDNRFVLKRDYEGQTTELELSEGEVLALARMIPSYARELIALRNRSEVGVFAWAAAPVVNYQIGLDALSQSILLRLKDDWEAEFDFSFTPDGAREIADVMGKYAKKAAEIPKINRQ